MENKKGKLGSRLAGSEAFLSVAASLICIVIGLLLGLVVLAIINAEHAFGDGLLVILKSGFKSPRNMGTVLANAAPLIMTGLSVGFAFKTGLFNIGAAGQYTLGAFGALYCAIVLQWPWYLCLLAAMLFGAIWGALPGIFKAYLNINEVITAIMFNWIGLYMVNDIMYGKGKSPMYDLASTKTYSLRKAAPQAMIPSLGMSELFGKLQSVTIAIFIAIFFAIIVYIILNKTAFGYELRACGFNKNAARYAGINEKRNIILAMMISGALAGVGAGLSLHRRGVEPAGLHGAARDGLQWHQHGAAGLLQPDWNDFLLAVHFVYHRRRHEALHAVLHQGNRRRDYRADYLSLRVLTAL